MFPGMCHFWRLQLVFQCRVQVTRIWGNIQVMSPMQPMCVFYLLRKYTFYVFYRNEIICDFLIEPMIYIYVLDVLSSFEYVENYANDIIANWIMCVKCGLNCDLSVWLPAAVEN